MSHTEGRLAPAGGAKIGVLVESKFIPEEISAYQSGFAMLGYEVELISRIWYGDYRPAEATFYGDVDPLDSQPWESPSMIKVRRDLSTVTPDNYAAVIMSANFTSVRLRYPGEWQPGTDPRKFVQSAPAVVWFAEAMRNPTVIKGALCHGLWILTPNPDLLRGRKVVCNAVVLADILNCEALPVMDAKVHTDSDLVTALSKHEVLPFIRAIADQIAAVSRP